MSTTGKSKRDILWEQKKKAREERLHTRQNSVPKQDGSQSSLRIVDKVPLKEVQSQKADKSIFYANQRNNGDSTNKLSVMVEDPDTKKYLSGGQINSTLDEHTRNVLNNQSINGTISHQPLTQQEQIQNQMKQQYVADQQRAQLHELAQQQKVSQQVTDQLARQQQMLEQQLKNGAFDTVGMNKMDLSDFQPNPNQGGPGNGNQDKNAAEASKQKGGSSSDEAGKGLPPSGNNKSKLNFNPVYEMSPELLDSFLKENSSEDDKRRKQEYGEYLRRQMKEKENRNRKKSPPDRVTKKIGYETTSSEDTTIESRQNFFPGQANKATAKKQYGDYLRQQMMEQNITKKIKEEERIGRNDPRQYEATKARGRSHTPAKQNSMLPPVHQSFEARHPSLDSQPQLDTRYIHSEDDEPDSPPRQITQQYTIEPANPPKGAFKRKKYTKDGGGLNLESLDPAADAKKQQMKLNFQKELKDQIEYRKRIEEVRKQKERELEIQEELRVKEEQLQLKARYSLEKFRDNMGRDRAIKGGPTVPDKDVVAQSRFLDGITRENPNSGARKRGSPKNIRPVTVSERDEEDDSSIEHPSKKLSSPRHKSKSSHETEPIYTQGSQQQQQQQYTNSSNHYSGHMQQGYPQQPPPQPYQMPGSGYIQPNPMGGGVPPHPNYQDPNQSMQMPPPQYPPPYGQPPTAFPFIVPYFMDPRFIMGQMQGMQNPQQIDMNSEKVKNELNQLKNEFASQQGELVKQLEELKNEASKAAQDRMKAENELLVMREQLTKEPELDPAHQKLYNDLKKENDQLLDEYQESRNRINPVYLASKKSNSSKTNTLSTEPKSILLNKSQKESPQDTVISPHGSSGPHSLPIIPSAQNKEDKKNLTRQPSSKELSPEAKNFPHLYMPPIEEYVPHKDTEHIIQNILSPQSEAHSQSMNNRLNSFNNNPDSLSVQKFTSGQSLNNLTDFQPLNSYNNELTELKPDPPYEEMVRRQQEKKSDSSKPPSNNTTLIPTPPLFQQKENYPEAYHEPESGRQRDSVGRMRPNEKPNVSFREDDRGQYIRRTRGYKRRNYGDPRSPNHSAIQQNLGFKPSTVRFDQDGDHQSEILSRNSSVLEGKHYTSSPAPINFENKNSVGSFPNLTQNDSRYLDKVYQSKLSLAAEAERKKSQQSLQGLSRNTSGGGMVDDRFLDSRKLKNLPTSSSNISVENLNAVNDNRLKKLDAYGVMGVDGIQGNKYPHEDMRTRHNSQESRIPKCNPNYYETNTSDESVLPPQPSYNRQDSKSLTHQALKKQSLPVIKEDDEIQKLDSLLQSHMERSKTSKLNESYY